MVRLTDDDLVLLKSAWEEHNFLTKPIKNALNECYKK